MLTQARLKEFLAYDPETGVFTNIKSGKGRKPVGSVADSPHKDGYTTSMIDGKNYMHHRIAWLYVHGIFPPDDIDHINGLRSDNRLCNLRAARRFENCQNTESAGVWFEAGKWRASLAVQGEKHYLGRHSTKVEAEAARRVAKAQLHQFQPTTRKIIRDLSSKID